MLPRAGKVKGELPRILAILVITAAKGRLCSVNTGAAGDSPREGQEYPCSQGCESVQHWVRKFINPGVLDHEHLGSGLATVVQPCCCLLRCMNPRLGAAPSHFGKCWKAEVRRLSPRRVLRGKKTLLKSRRQKRPHRWLQMQLNRQMARVPLKRGNPPLQVPVKM